MKDFLEEIKDKYISLNGRLEELKKKEEENDKVRKVLLEEFHVCDDKLEKASDKYCTIKNKIDRDRNRYANKRCTNRTFGVFLGVTCAAFLLALGQISLGIIEPTLTVFVSCFGMGAVTSLLDINFLWDRRWNKSLKKFDKLESTKELKKEEDEAYVEKLHAKDAYMDVQVKIINNTNKLNDIRREKSSIISEINNIRFNTFDQIINGESVELEGPKLSLK